MTITAGLFKLDMTDYHAVLGCSLAADPKEVRKRYLKIARQLHPDSLREASAEQKQLASELLSKQVNPAYEALGNEKKAAEYHALLKLKQKILVAQPGAIAPQSEAAKLLLTARNYDNAYAEALPKMASAQFDDLTQIESVTGDLSELNAVYLVRQATATAKTDAKPARATSASAQTANPAPAARPKSSSQPEIIERYFSRAEEFESQKDYARAILELREVTAAHPKSAACHGYLSSLYLQSGQATLAKIHAKQALAFDPSNRLAKDVQEKLARVPAGASGATRAPKSNSAASGEKSGGGKSGGSLLSGLFGGKKR